MKKFLLALAIMFTPAAAFSQQKAIYVKKGDTYTKYNFGVAGDLRFSNGGKTLTVTGYNEAINLDNVDYITFSAPVDNTSMTPSAQKERLVQIGEEVNKMVDMNKNADLILLFDAFFRDRSDRPISDYNWDRQYWDVHNKLAKVAKSASDIANGNPAATAALRSAAVDLYKLPDYFGVFKANTSTYTWDKTSDAQYLEFRFPGFKGEEYSVRLEGSVQSSVWNTPDANVEVPATMSMSFMKNGIKIATAVINTAMVQDSYINMDVTFDSGSYVVVNNLKILNDGITENIEVKFDGKYLCSFKNKVDGKNLLDYEEMKDAVKSTQHTHDEHGNCLDDEDYSKLYAHVFRASSDIDVLGQLQVKGKAFSFGKLQDALDSEDYMDPNIQDGECEYYADGKVIDWNPATGILRFTRDIPSAVAKKVKYLNNYVDAPFFYDGKEGMQGYLSWGENCESEDWWLPEDDEYGKYGYIIKDGMLVSVLREADTSYDPVTNTEVKTWSDWFYYAWGPAPDYEMRKITVNENDVIHPTSVITEYYGFQPVVVFPDQTSFAVEEYFTETAFKSLVDDIDDIIDTYYSITGQVRNPNNY